MIKSSMSLLAFSLLASAALAQVPASPEVNLKVTIEEIELISAGLQTQPFGKVSPLMNKLQKQINDQFKPAEAPKPAEPVKPE